MDVPRIIAEIDIQIARLKQASALLSQMAAKTGPSRPKKTEAKPASVFILAKNATRRSLSSTTRKKIANEQGG